MKKIASGAMLALLMIAMGNDYVASARVDRRAGVIHPLDDLTGPEIVRAIELLRKEQHLDSGIRFPNVVVQEPAKADVLAAREEGAQRLPRKVFVAAFDPARNVLTEYVVDLSASKIDSVRPLPGVQPPILPEEYEILSEITKADTGYRAAIAKRGLSLDDLYVDGWAPGILTDDEASSGTRFMRAITYFKGTYKNLYARPIEGLIATLDMNRRQVVSIRDIGVVPLAKGGRDLDAESNKPHRRAPTRLSVTQPNGVSFQVKGREVRWQNWRFRFSMQPMKGLVLYQVGYEDKGRLRPILYKASLSEMVVPYGDPAKTWSFRNAFDVGEYGLGKTAHPLVPLLDAPSNAVFFDATIADDLGEPLVIPRAVALYERDGGLLWKHHDSTNGEKFGRRGRELVLSFTTTIGNYDYGINWIFHQDGVLEVDVFLTGILLAKGTDVAVSECDVSCTRLVEPLVTAPNHQHFFNFRIDLDVDGAKGNRPVEMNTSSMPWGAANPDGNAFEMTSALLNSERSAVRDLHFETARRWKVMNADSRNAFGHPVGYMLMTGENSVPLLHERSVIRRRAGFINHPVWFTRYRDEEQSAAGEYPNQSKGGEGLPLWTSDDEPLDREDVVLWYTFGVTHVPKPEEWPVMNVHHAGFKLVPANFFSANPAMNIP